MWSSSFLASPQFSSSPKLSLLSSSSFHHKIQTFLCYTQNPSSSTTTIGINFSKRQLNLSILTLLFNSGFLLDKARFISDDFGDLQRYTDSKDGFTLLSYPLFGLR